MSKTIQIPQDLAKVVPREIRRDGGADRVRTDDLRLARAALSQLSYCPDKRQQSLVGLGGLEPPASRLSGVRSNQLSYRPALQRTAEGSLKTGSKQLAGRPRMELPSSGSSSSVRKEVIQPQVLLRLPCYDFTPIADHTFDGCLPEGLAHRLLVQPTFVM